jgi:hypothetical protein
VLCPGTTLDRPLSSCLIFRRLEITVSASDAASTKSIVPKDLFLAQYLIPSKLASLTPEREFQVFMPFAGDLPNYNFAAYEAEMIMWKCKWQNVTEKPSTLIDTLKHAYPELYPNILIVASILLVYQQAHCLCAVAYQLSSVCSVIHSAFRQDLLCPGTTLARHCHPVLHPKENFRFLCHLQATCPITILQSMKRKW